MIKAIAFDLGGVFATNAPRHIIREIALEYDKDVMDVLKSWNRYWNTFITGKLTEDQFYESLIRELHILGNRRPTIEDLKVKARNFLAIMPHQFHNIKVLKEQLPKMKFALLSNNSKEWYEYLASDHDFSIFDVVINSCDMGIAKPQAAIFEKAITELDLKPAEILFIDDKSSNVDGAFRAHLEGFVFTNFSDLADKLKDLKTIDDKKAQALKKAFTEEIEPTPAPVTGDKGTTAQEEPKQ